MITINNIYELQKIGKDASYPLDGEYELAQVLFKNLNNYLN